jgi:hypothetical protein
LITYSKPVKEWLGFLTVRFNAFFFGSTTQSPYQIQSMHGF